MNNEYAQPNKSRCYKCNKKIGLTGIKCKCNLYFCSKHRYAEEHNCSYDYKDEGKKRLKRSLCVDVGNNKKIRKI